MIQSRATRACAGNSGLAKAKCKSRSKSEGKSKSKENEENPKEPRVPTKVPKAYTRAKHRKLVFQVLRTRNRMQNDGWSYDEWNDDWSFVGWNEVWEHSYDTSANSFSLGGLDLGATCSPKRFERVKMNLDTGAAVNTFPSSFGPERAGDRIFHQSAQW